MDGSSCIVPNCKNTNCDARKTAAQIAFEETMKISFHRFPCDSAKRAQWIEILKLDGKNISKSSVLCSLHFKEKFIDRTYSDHIILRENAVPHVFESIPYFEVMDTSISNEEESLSSNSSENINCRIVPDLVLKRALNPIRFLNDEINEPDDGQTIIEEDTQQISVKEEQVSIIKDETEYDFVLETSDEYVSVMESNSGQIPIAQSTCDKETNTSPPSLFVETHDRATRMSPERIWNSSSSHEIKKIANDKITNLRTEIRSLKEILRQKNKRLAIITNIINTSNNQKLARRQGRLESRK
ncbi:PREDICTED: uncharacterized protein LOC105563670 [Vollenhovia emeryi]|uniref:uncharacterized protein LOC105563670 n=1 Tax=Vollenhovia emeryi TaxID=411798 RepID=UPI0005F4D19D|nr:PREDICTED: uncharacterized protein LOC105563670 [Vollenhovia emeryi]